MFTGPFLRLCLLLMSETLHDVNSFSSRWFFWQMPLVCSHSHPIRSPPPQHGVRGRERGRERSQRLINMSKYMKRVSGSWHSWFYLLTVKAKHLIISDISSLMYTVQLEICLEEMKEAKETLKKLKSIFAGQQTQTPKSHVCNEPITCPFSSSSTPSPETRDRKCYLEHSRESTEGCGETAGRRGTLGCASDPKRPR